MEKYVALVGLFLLHLVLLSLAVRLAISSLGVWAYSEMLFKHTVMRLYLKGWEPRKAAARVTKSMRYLRVAAPVGTVVLFSGSALCLWAFLNMLE